MSRKKWELEVSSRSLSNWYASFITVSVLCLTLPCLEILCFGTLIKILFSMLSLVWDQECSRFNPLGVLKESCSNYSLSCASYTQALPSYVFLWGWGKEVIQYHHKQGGWWYAASLRSHCSWNEKSAVNTELFCIPFTWWSRCASLFQRDVRCSPEALLLLASKYF